jgi:peptidoglycan/xylan/chitin deacetylase (PgdA/CDA1 family)
MFFQLTMIIQKIIRKVYKLFHPPVGEVLMLHRVVEERSLLAANRKMEITPEFLEQTIRAYIQKGWQIISLDEVYEITVNNKKQKKPFVCFTFDDGYVDNYEIAYSIFKKYNCPFAIYVATDFPDRKAAMWWYALEAILKENDLITLGDGTQLPAATIDEKNAVFEIIRSNVFQAKYMEERVGAMLKNYSFSYSILADRLALSWDQIAKLAADPLCTIGSHAVTHAPLTNLLIKKVIEELHDSKTRIEDRILKPVEHFAYPYGIYNQQIAVSVEHTGYKMATLANGGKVRLEKRSEFIIKRISLEE